MVLVLKKGATKKEIATIHRKLASMKKFNVKKFCGVIRLEEDALAIQKQMRS